MGYYKFVTMNHQELYKLLLTVQKNVRCPQCGKAYDFGGIQIRGILDQIVFLELNCSSHMPLLATVTLTKQTPRMTAETKERVDSNDVIDTYHFLKDYKGSFADIFKQISPSENNK